MRQAPKATVTSAVALTVAVLSVSWAAILIRWCEAESLAIAVYRLLFAPRKQD